MTVRIFWGTAKGLGRRKNSGGKIHYSHWNKVTERDCGVNNKNPVAVVMGDSGRITSPESGYKFLICSVLPGVILRLLYDKGENLIKLGRKIKSLNGSRRGKKGIEVTREAKTWEQRWQEGERKVSGERNHQEGIWQNRPPTEGSRKTEAIDHKWQDFQIQKLPLVRQIVS